MKAFAKIISDLLLAFIIFLPFESFSQTPDWINYLNGQNVKSLRAEGSYIWVGTVYGGLIRLNRTDGTMAFYNKANCGLPDNTIQAMSVDQQGNRWFGTPAGLVKFDGTNWTVYNTANSGIPDNNVTSLVFDFQGALWVGTRNGLARLNGATWTVYNTSNSNICSNIINCLAIDNLGMKWIGTINGLNKYDIDMNTWSWYNPVNSGISDIIINALHWQNGNGLWIGTNNRGIDLFDGAGGWNNWDYTTTPIPDNTIYAIAQEGLNNLWFGTLGGIAKFDGVAWTEYKKPIYALPDNRVMTLILDNASNIWFGTPTTVCKYDGTNFTSYNTSNSALQGNSVSSVAEETNSTKWIGLSSTGALRFDAASWTAYRKAANGLPHDNVNQICIDASNVKWFATDSGLGKFDGSTWTTYRVGNSNIPGDIVNCLASDTGAVKWVGTTAGLGRFNGTNWTNFTMTNSSIPDNIVQTIVRQSPSVIWLGTNTGGLARFDGSVFSIYDMSNSDIPSNNVRDIAIDSKGLKWLATANGLAKYNDTTWTIYNTSNSAIPSNDLTSLFIDQNGIKWIGTVNSGFCAFDTSFVLYNKGNSDLPDNRTNDLLSDKSGNKWIATDLGGLSVFRQGGILPTITTGTVAGPYCVDQALNVTFTVFASVNNFVGFGSSNNFIAQLSDVNGFFANPKSIGFLSGTTAGTIACRIPKDSVGGTKFRIRVVSSNPAANGTDNQSGFTIYTLPKPAINGELKACSGGVLTYKTAAQPGVAFKWSATGGTIIGSTVDSNAVVTWGAPGMASLKVIQTTPAGCKDSVSISVQIYSMPPKTITGPKTVCSYKTEVYSAADDSTVFNDWYATGGEVLQKVRFNKVLIQWDNPGQGTLKLVQTTKNGCRDSVVLTVTKQNAPRTSFTGPNNAKYRSTKTYTAGSTPSGITNKWLVTGGVIPGSSTGNTVQIRWGDGPLGVVTLVQTATSGCTDTVHLDVVIYEPVRIGGSLNVCENMVEDYAIGSNINLSPDNFWRITGGIFQGDSTRGTCRIKWGAAGNGSIRLIQFMPATGYRDTLLRQVKINPKPVKPTVTVSQGWLRSSQLNGNRWYMNGSRIFEADSQYFYTDERNGVYSVMIVDTNGCESDMSDPVNYVSGVEDDELALSGISVYPNPSDGNVTLEFFRSSTKQTSVRIVNNLGVTVFITDNINPENRKYNIDLRNYAQGVYTVIIGIDDRIIRKRIVLQRN